MATIVRPVIGALIGGTLGFLMYRFVGCKTGACPLTANPFIAIFVWAGIGALLAAGSTR